jgi:hypothetical protein
MTYRTIISLFATVTMLTNVACTTTRSYAGVDVYEYGAFNAGESLKITETDGSEYKLEVIEVTALSVIGERDGVGRVEVPLEDIRFAEFAQFDGEKTYWSVMGVAAAVSVVGVLTLMEATGATWGH